jgi:hypothetical protein
MRVNSLPFLPGGRAALRAQLDDPDSNLTFGSGMVRSAVMPC